MKCDEANWGTSLLYFIAASDIVPTLGRLKRGKIYTAFFGGSDFAGVD
jgi:hypothetical protein